LAELPHPLGRSDVICCTATAAAAAAQQGALDSESCIALVLGVWIATSDAVLLWHVNTPGHPVEVQRHVQRVRILFIQSKHLGFDKLPVTVCRVNTGCKIRLIGNTDTWTFVHKEFRCIKLIRLSCTTFSLSTNCPPPGPTNSQLGQQLQQPIGPAPSSTLGAVVKANLCSAIHYSGRTSGNGEEK
jgi:hypothetical protein